MKNGPLGSDLVGLITYRGGIPNQRQSPSIYWAQFIATLFMRGTMLLQCHLIHHVSVACIQPSSYCVAAAAGTNHPGTPQGHPRRSTQDAVSGSSRQTAPASRSSEAESRQSAEFHVDFELARSARRCYHHAGSENTGQLRL